MARCLKFRIQKLEGLYYLCSENKCADQLLTAKLICVFAFAYAKSRFSHDAAHIKVGFNGFKFHRYVSMMIYAIVVILKNIIVLSVLLKNILSYLHSEEINYDC